MNFRQYVNHSAKVPKCWVNLVAIEFMGYINAAIGNAAILWIVAAKPLQAFFRRDIRYYWMN